MATISREDVFEALFELTDITEVKTRDRRAKDFDQVNQVDQPAVFQTEDAEPFDTSRGVPDISRPQASWIIYTNSQGEDGTPSTPMNVIVQALLLALQPPAGRDVNTLDGLVSRVYPGQVQYFEGQLGAQAMTIIPINVVFVPQFDAAGC